MCFSLLTPPTPHLSLPPPSIIEPLLLLLFNTFFSFFSTSSSASAYSSSSMCFAFGKSSISNVTLTIWDHYRPMSCSCLRWSFALEWPFPAIRNTVLTGGTTVLRLHLFSQGLSIHGLIWRTLWSLYRNSSHRVHMSKMLQRIPSLSYDVPSRSAR